MATPKKVDRSSNPYTVSHDENKPNDCCAGGFCGCGTPPKSLLEVNRPRSCQDFIVTLIFVAFCVGLAVLSGWASEHGSVLRIVYGSDSYGNVCGVNNYKQIDNNNSGLDLTNYQHEYYTLTSSSSFPAKLCVAECPSYDLTFGFEECSNNQTMCTSSGLCLMPFPMVANALSPYTVDAPTPSCPQYIFDTQDSGLVKFCFPLSANSTVGSLFSDIRKDTWVESQKLFSNFYAARVQIFSLLVLAAAASFVFIGCMRCCAGPIVYLVIAIASCALLALSGTLWFYGIRAEVDVGKAHPSEKESKETVFYVLIISAAVVTVFTLVFMCVICAMRKKIVGAVCIVEEASVAFMTMPTTFLCPLFTWMFMLAWIAICGVIFAYVVTSQDVSLDSDGFVHYTDAPDTKFAILYTVIALFWGVELFVAMEEFVIGSCVVIWYLSGAKPKGVPLFKSIFRLFRFHFGSIALGALIIAIIQVIRTILEYFEHQFERHKDKIGCLVRFLLCCVNCCLFCFQRCVKFLNKNAYIEIAIWGDGFFSSACRAMRLLLDHILMVSLVNGVSHMIQWVIKVAVSMSIGILAYLWLESMEDQVPLYPVVAASMVLFSFVVVSAFTSMIEIGAEAILICLCEDHEMSPYGSYLIPKRLRRVRFGERDIGHDRK
eukprot:m.105192 g.105192  ORF g.105192 m.105192 type:complete len:658 (+) comp27628_c0_seq2:710-2683(+)